MPTQPLLQFCNGSGMGDDTNCLHVHKECVLGTSQSNSLFKKSLIIKELFIYLNPNLPAETIIIWPSAYCYCCFLRYLLSFSSVLCSGIFNISGVKYSLIPYPHLNNLYEYITHHYSKSKLFFS